MIFSIEKSEFVVGVTLLLIFIGLFMSLFSTLQSKTYDSVTEKFMDFSFEKVCVY
jgi:hypothetical protein